MLRRFLLVALALALTVALGARDSSAASAERNGRIAFEHIGESDGAAIYSLTSRGTQRRLLTPGRRASSRSPSYSPDGRRIAFVSGYKQAEIWLMRADGTHKRQLTHSKGIAEADPAWSPDGKEIAFDIERDPVTPSPQQGIWVVGVDGRDRRRLTSGADGDPAWSPDGTEIAFDRYDDETQVSNIFVVPAAGGTATELSSDTTDPGVSDWEPAWSPDGSRILFVSDRPSTFGSNLWVMQADGTDARRVTNTDELDETDPAWSPDGRRIVFTGETQHNYQVFVSDANGAHRRTITHGCDECSVLDDAPSWQPLP